MYYRIVKPKGFNRYLIETAMLKIGKFYFFKMPYSTGYGNRFRTINYYPNAVEAQEQVDRLVKIHAEYVSDKKFMGAWQ